jgi:hypothetical protein
MKCKFGLWRNSAVIIALVVAVLLSATAASAQPGTATTRPIEEFVAAQGTYCVELPDGSCLDIFRGVPDLVFWGIPGFPRSAYVDFAGHTEAYLAAHGGPPLGTEIHGKIVERLLADGRAAVHVVLKVDNTLAWVTEEANAWTIKDATLLFGNRAADVLAGEQPGLCDAHFEVKFINTAPGAPMPDLIQLLFRTEPGQEPKFVSVHCHATGPLREAFGVEDGTPGRANILARPLYIPPPDEDLGYKLPVLRVDLHTFDP